MYIVETCFRVVEIKVLFSFKTRGVAHNNDRFLFTILGVVSIFKLRLPFVFFSPLLAFLLVCLYGDFGGPIPVIFCCP